MNFIKLILTLVFISNVVYANRFDDNSLSEFLKSYYPKVKIEDVVSHYAQTEQIFKIHGLNPTKLSDLSNFELFQLWKIPFGSNLGPDFQSLKTIINFWISELGVQGLNQYIQNTTHINPYHLFKLNLVGWMAYRDLLLTIGVFDEDPNSDRSLNAFLLRFNWGEGVVTSQSQSPEFWNSWKSIFLIHTDLRSKVIEAFNIKYLSAKQNQDLIQRLYISLTKDMLSMVLKYPDLVSEDLILDLINPKDKIIRAVFYDNINTLLVKLKILIQADVEISGLRFTSTVARAVVSDLVLKSIEDPNILKDENVLKLAIGKILKKNNKNKISNSLNLNPGLCHEYLR